MRPPSLVLSAVLAAFSATALATSPPPPPAHVQAHASAGVHPVAHRHAAPADGFRHLSAYLYPGGEDVAYLPSDFVDESGTALAALSFDDGPDLVSTPRVLDALAASGHRATFFVVGARTTARNPDEQAGLQTVMRRIVSEGGEIGSHSHTHPFLSRRSEAKIRQELTDAQEAISRAAPGTEVHWFRPPYGACDARVVAAASRLGMRTIRWTVDPQEWRRDMPPEAIVRSVLARLRPGAVVLLHSTRANVAEALPAILEGARLKGFRFVTVSDWWARLRRPVPQVQAGGG